jgi:mycofactocin precursor
MTAKPSRRVRMDEHEIEADTTDEDLVEEELLVEEVSIDGMCGVY